MAQNFGANTELNQKLAQATGYTGNFGTGEYGQWLDANPQYKAVSDKIQTDWTNNARNVSATQINNPTMPTGTVYNPTAITPKAGEMMTAPQIDPNGAQAQTSTATAQTASQVTPKEANTYQASQIGNQTPQMEAEQGQLSEEAKVKAAQGTASQEFLDTINQRNAEIDATQLDPRATVQEQYKQLTSGDMAWAKGAIREANALMSARGLGASSLAAGEVTMAILKAALPIASQDAQAFQTIQLEKMNQKQAATLLKASHLANLDLKNLDNRQQAAVVNAQNFLQMDLANLQNRQQATVLNTQARVQTMLSDQAADNAAKQFNAASKNQVMEFFEGLSAQIDMFNTSQVNEMSRFNTDQKNAQERFNSGLQNQREQFNTQNSLVVQQSNTKWLRDINTRNTAYQNEANYVNTQNLLQMSNTALANELQFLRDEMSFAFTASENQLNRMENRALMVLNRDMSLGLMDEQQKAALGQMMGSFASSVLTGTLNNWDKIFGKTQEAAA